MNLADILAARRPNGPVPGMPIPGIVGGFGGGEPAGRMAVPEPSPPAASDGPNQSPRGLFGARESLPVDPSQAAPLAPLGHSLNQPFDYEGAINSMLPPQKQHSKTHNTIMKILEIAAPALMAAGGNDAGAQAFISQMAQRRRDAENQRFEVAKAVAGWKHQDFSQQHSADLSAAAPFTIGRNRLQYNPASGTVNTLYHGNADFEDYATSKGLEPGTPDYFRAVEDYVLRGNGPTALGYDKQLDDYRTGNRRELERLRQGNRVLLEGVRQKDRIGMRSVPTYRDLHPRAPGREAMPTVSTPDEAMKLPPGTKFRTPTGEVRIRP